MRIKVTKPENCRVRHVNDEGLDKPVCQIKKGPDGWDLACFDDNEFPPDCPLLIESIEIEME